MQKNNPQNLAFYWATRFVRSLYKEGVRKAVISPGSRSTPLTLALAAHPGFEKSIVLDERSAAFIALGQAKATGIPSVLVCTSGTALANYTPAVTEAANSGIPMIVASADRPPHLRAMGASQTIDQIKIFGSNVVFFHEAGEPSDNEKKLKRLETAAAQAVHYARQKSGPVHINFPFSKPLEPTIEFLQEIESENKESVNIFNVPADISFASAGRLMDETLLNELNSVRKPVIITGCTNRFEDYSFILSLADFLDAPILAEPGVALPSSPRKIHGYSGFLRDDEISDSLRPDLIIRCGAYPVSKALHLYLEKHAGARQISFVHPNLWQDGDQIPSQRIFLDQIPAFPDIQTERKPEWMGMWKKIELAFADFRNKTIRPKMPLTDGYVFATLSKLLPANAFVMLSNSFPVRDFSLFSGASDADIYVNRGAAGIDGIISTSIGISSTNEKPGVLFIGDLAFLHDTNALLSRDLVKNPLVIVVLNNNGGTIFRMLPAADFTDKYTTYFETPQQVNISALCHAYGLEHRLVTRPEELVKTFEESLLHSGIQVIECITDASDSMQERRALWAFKEDGAGG